VRTKYFFNARYLWTQQEMQVHSAKRANGDCVSKHVSVSCDEALNAVVTAGIRTDVDRIQPWMRESVEEKLVSAGILKSNFVNSFAVNM
jgi:hypothetical protein